MVNCEFCNTNDYVRYVNFGVSIIGADVCPSCEKITRTREFKIEVATLLNGKEGDLDKFFRRGIDIKDPKCRMCGIWLEKDTWYDSHKKAQKFICKGCYGEQLATAKNAARCIVK